MNIMFLTNEEIIALSLAGLAAADGKPVGEVVQLSTGGVSRVQVFRDGSMRIEGPMSAVRMSILGKIADRLLFVAR